jgi:flagellar biosynthetic protein FliR
MDLLNLPIDQFKVFLMILIRVSLVMYMFPVFSSSMIPASVKAGMALLMSLVLTPVVPVDPARFPVTVPAMLIYGISEFFVGMVLSLSIHLFMASVELAGQLVGFQMGFSIINVLDPQTGTQVSIMGQIGNLVMVMIFLALNGHHALITGLVESFRLVPVGMIALKKGLLNQMLQLVTDMFSLAVQVGAPAIVALLFTSTAFGITAKFVPQMNILVAAFPIKIVVGLVFFGFTIQILAIITRTFIAQCPALFTSLLQWMGGG